MPNAWKCMELLPSSRRRDFQRGGPKMSYDAVVIGAGHNGLAAAVRLAEKGWTRRGRRGKERAGRRGQDPGADAAGLPPRPLRDEPVDVRRLAASSRPTRRRSCDRALPSRPRRIVSPASFATGPISASARSLDKTAAGIAALSPADAEAWRDLVHALRRRRAAYFRAARLADALARGGEGRLEGLAAARDRHGSSRRCGCCWRARAIFSTRVSRIPRSRR